MNRAGIFGPSLSGKTTLAKALSRQYWRSSKIQTLVLDPNDDKDWGDQARVFTDEQKFWDTVWISNNCIVLAEEASETINRDGKLTSVFTRLRHRQHKLIVVGHSGASLLPVMRQQLDTLYLFLQSRKAAQIWCEETACDKLMGATQLNQYEFLYYERFKPVKKMRLTL